MAPISSASGVRLIAAYLEPHCDPASPFLLFISKAFRSCIPTNQTLFSTVLGFCSLGAWLFAQLPQIFYNYNAQRGDGLAMGFILLWLSGDSCNLLGAILTDQATWQRAVAGYYVSVDFVLMFQWWYYSSKGNNKSSLTTLSSSETSSTRPHSSRANRRTNSRALSYTAVADEQSDQEYPAGQSLLSRHATRSSSRTLSASSLSKVLPFKKTARSWRSTCFIFFGAILVFTGVAMLLSIIFSPRHEPHRAEDGSFLRIPELPIPSPTFPKLTPLQMLYIGRVLAWLSTCSYAYSRIPQIKKMKAQQQEVLRDESAADLEETDDGVSMFLFYAAWCGNFFYSTSLLSNPRAIRAYPAWGERGWSGIGPEGSTPSVWWTDALPFFLGAFIVLVADAYLLGSKFQWRRRMLKRSEMMESVRLPNPEPDSPYQQCSENTSNFPSEHVPHTYQDIPTEDGLSDVREPLLRDSTSPVDLPRHTIGHGYFMDPDGARDSGSESTSLSNFPYTPGASTPVPMMVQRRNRSALGSWFERMQTIARAGSPSRTPAERNPLLQEAQEPSPVGSVGSWNYGAI